MPMIQTFVILLLSAALLFGLKENH